MKADHNLLKEGKCLLCKLAFEQKNYALVSKYSKEIYEINPSYEIALLNSKAYARLKEPSLAGAWLMTVSQFGADYRERIQKIMSEQVYDFVREQDVFKHYIEKSKIFL